MSKLEEKRIFTIFLNIGMDKTIKKRVIGFLESDFNGVIKIKEESGRIRWIKNYQNVVSEAIKS